MHQVSILRWLRRAEREIRWAMDTLTLPQATPPRNGRVILYAMETVQKKTAPQQEADFSPGQLQGR